MIQAELKNIFSLFIDDLDSYSPKEPENFDCFKLQVRLMIGIKGQEGEESFDLIICTPKWLTSQCEHNYAIWGKYLLIVEYYNFDKIKTIVASHVSSYYGKDWSNIALRLCSVGAWEYENYQN